MCGIAGIYRRHRPDEGDPSRIVAMSGRLVHRGPDACGYLLLDSRDGEFQLAQNDFAPQPCDVCLGHRRLSIIDLSSQGRQPMANPANDLFVVFNGEIFNYLELREQLASRGHRFRTHSEAEVIVQAYEEWGPECVMRFNGMWALTIWDQRRRQMFCSRDRFGIKPFYYSLDDSAFSFASEIKGLLPALQAPPRADYSVLSEYLIDGALCRTSATFFEGIRRLPAAHNLIVSPTSVKLSRYWDYKTQSQAYDERHPVETFRELLSDAVKLSLRSDVPVGIALSGGIDSSSILSLASRCMDPSRLKTFTAVFPGERYDESEYAGFASKAAGVELFCVNYQPRDFIADLRRVIWSLDYPALEGQTLARWQLMKVAGGHVKVILEGQGADEMLAGYVGRYFPPYVLDELGRRTSGRQVLSLRELIASSLEVHHRYGLHAYEGLVRQIAPRWLPLRAIRNLWADSRVYTRDFMQRNPGRLEAPAAVFEDRLNALLHYDHETAILPMLLKFGDALSMAASIESRVPFLDHRLVEFVFRLPAQHKLRGPISKGILREAMAGIVPERILRRNDKIGFATPVGRWIAGCMDSGVRPVLLSKRCRERGIFDTQRIEKLLDKQTRGQASVEHSIFRWLSVELWFRLFIDGDGIAESTAMPESNWIKV